jgi:hypothetical protein
MTSTFASLINLDHPGHYLHWGILQISVANLVVVVTMVVVFVLAVAAPFPGRRRREEEGQ